jgi:hypothetical protein
VQGAPAAAAARLDGDDKDDDAEADATATDDVDPLDAAAACAAWRASILPARVCSARKRSRRSVCGNL